MFEHEDTTRCHLFMHHDYQKTRLWSIESEHALGYKHPCMWKYTYNLHSLKRYVGVSQCSPSSQKSCNGFQHVSVKLWYVQRPCLDRHACQQVTLRVVQQQNKRSHLKQKIKCTPGVVQCVERLCLQVLAKLLRELSSSYFHV